MADARHAEHLLKSLYLMASFVEARDAYTGGHLWRVAQFAKRLAQATGLSRKETLQVSLGGFLHDLGKIGVPDSILQKPGRLDDHEYAIIKTHPTVGADLVRSHPLANLVLAAIEHHHETPDGRGYPAGLSGDTIPLQARIVGIADAFDAMTSTRPYRQGMPADKALSIIEQNRGTQFDAALADHFVQLGRSGQLADIIGHSEPGIPLLDCPMCGPTITITRAHKAHDHIYCRSCGGEFELLQHAGRPELLPTGKQGAPRDLQPAVDEQLIDELVQETLQALELDSIPAPTPAPQASGKLLQRLRSWF